MNAIAEEGYLRTMEGTAFRVAPPGFTLELEPREHHFADEKST